MNSGPFAQTPSNKLDPLSKASYTSNRPYKSPYTIRAGSIMGTGATARANAPVRTNLLKLWFGTAEARGGEGFRAATGLNLEYHRTCCEQRDEIELSQTSDVVCQVFWEELFTRRRKANRVEAGLRRKALGGKVGVFSSDDIGCGSTL
jgi:hypothetical protein